MTGPLGYYLAKFCKDQFVKPGAPGPPPPAEPRPEPPPALEGTPRDPKRPRQLWVGGWELSSYPGAWRPGGAQTRKRRVSRVRCYPPYARALILAHAGYATPALYWLCSAAMLSGYAHAILCWC